MDFCFRMESEIRPIFPAVQLPSKDRATIPLSFISFSSPSSSKKINLVVIRFWTRDMWAFFPYIRKYNQIYPRLSKVAYRLRIWRRRRTSAPIWSVFDGRRNYQNNFVFTSSCYWLQWFIPCVYSSVWSLDYFLTTAWFPIYFVCYRNGSNR